MRRATARPVLACFVRSCCSVVVQEHDLRATPVQCNAKRRLSSHFTLHSSHPALHTSHLQFALHTSSHLKSCELFSPHLSSSHLIPSLLTCQLSKFFSTVFISSERWSTFLISSKIASTHLSCSARQKALAVREKSLAQKKTIGRRNFCTQTLGTQMHLHRKPLQNTLYCKACTKHFPAILCITKLAQSTPQYYKACTEHFPVLLCTTKLAQSTSQYYFVLQSLHKARSKYYFVLQSLHKARSKYYFVLQSLHRALPSNTLYYKACTKHFPVLQSLHRALPSITLYYKACTKHFPVLLCTTKLAQSTFQ